MPLAGEGECMDPFSEEMNMMDELELSDLRVREAGIDEEQTMFDPETHPKAFKGMADPSEPTADHDGCECDVMLDTEPVELELGHHSNEFDVL